MLNRPDLLDRTCDTCAALQYDDRDGRLSGELRVNPRTKQPWPRKAGVRLPCSICPKLDPVTGRKIEATLPLAQDFLELVQIVEQTGGRCFSQEQIEDESLQAAIACVGRFVKECQSRKAANITASAIANSLG